MTLRTNLSRQGKATLWIHPVLGRHAALQSARSPTLPFNDHAGLELPEGTCNAKEELSLHRGRVGAVGLPRISAPLASLLRCITANCTRAIGSPSIMTCQCDSTCGRLRY